MSGKFEILDHTADIRMRIESETLKSIFETAAKGLTSQWLDIKTVKPVISRSLHVMGENLEECLLNWLRELIYLFEVHGIVFSIYNIYEDNFSPISLNCREIRAFCQGERLDLKRHSIFNEVKAVTRHGLFLKQEGPTWLAEIILDV